MDKSFVVERADPLALEVGRVRRIVGIVIVDHQRPHLGDRQRLAHDAREFAVDNHDFRLGMIELESDDAVEAGVERMQDCLHHRHAEMDLEHRRRVGEHDGDGVTFTDALARQRGGELQAAGQKSR